MTEEQRAARKKSAEEGNIRWIKDHCIRTKDGNDDYVFISYKSDDYEKVLDGILFRTCQKYGLRVYFDTAFDEKSDSWITQYYKNMCDPHCKAFIAFIDDAYYSSYACLLEMMSRKTMAAGGDYKEDSLFFLPINIDSITEIVDASNTGLGTRRFSNGKLNIHAEMELKQFNEIFSEVADDYMRKVYKREKDDVLYDEAYKDRPKYGELYLTVTQCRRLMERVIPNKNENDGGNKAFEDVIHDKLINEGITSVFGEISSNTFVEPKPIIEYNVVIVNGDFKKNIKVKENECVPKQDSGVKDGFDFGGWFVSGTNEEWDFSTPIHKDIEIYAKWETADVGPTQPNQNGPDQKDEHVYTIFGQEYHAGGREQGKLMFDAFEALTTRYPEYAEQLTQRTSVAKAEDVKNANTKNADPTYFRGCKAFNIEGVEYLVGTSYGYKAKLSEIKGMFKICGVPLSEFVLDGEPLGSGHTDPMPPVEKTLWEYNTKGTRSKLMWNGEITGVSAVITVLKGSAVAAPSQNFEKYCKPAYTLKADLEAKGIIQNGKFTQDYTYDKVSTMINLLNGGSVSTPAEVKSGNLRKLDENNKDVVKGKEDIADDIEDLSDNDMNDGDVGMATTSGFEYTLWGISHTSNKMSDMMHDVFDLIAEKYPGKISELANSDAISSVARKDDVDGGNLPASKLNYFRASREHNVNGIAYYVGTSYNRSQGIGQIERMLKICEGSADSFVITSSPERISHSGGNTGKKGLDELL